MATNYKTSADDATTMAQAWYAMAGVKNPTPKAVAWWAKQIQQDGSHTAFLNFQTGKGQDQADAFDPKVLAQNTAKLKSVAQIDPWQPDPTTPQLAGTNTKNLSGVANQNPLLSGIVASTVTMNPFIGAGVANASHPGGTGLDYLKGGLAAAAITAPFASTVSNAANTLVNGAPAGGTPGGTPGGGTPSTPGGGLLDGVTKATGLTTADILKLGGSALTAGTNYAENAAQLSERKREFDASNALATQNTALNEGQTAVNTQNRLNTAPLADKSQYLLSAMQSNGPQTFKPRDYTQPGGTANLNTPATGGAQAQLAANNAASASYTPGAGGVDTSALQLLLAKLKGSGSAFGTMPTTSSMTG